MYWREEERWKDARGKERGGGIVKRLYEGQIQPGKDCDGCIETGIKKKWKNYSKRKKECWNDTRKRGIKRRYCFRERQYGKEKSKEIEREKYKVLIW